MAEKQKDAAGSSVARPSWRPFEKIKNILSKKTRSRSNSPDHSAISFTAGVILHAHTSTSTFEEPNAYILVSTTNRGTILPFEPTSNQLIGFLVCECKPELQYTTQPKNIVFIPKPYAGVGHFINSPFVMPELSSAQKLVSKSYPLFYRLPASLSHLTPNEALTETDIVTIRKELIAELSNLTDSVETNDIKNVYQQLFNISDSPPPTPSESSNQSHTDPSEQGYDLLRFNTHEETGPLNLSTFQTRSDQVQTNTDTNTTNPKSLGVLVYKKPHLDAWKIPKRNSLTQEVEKTINKNVRRQVSTNIVGLFIHSQEPTPRVNFYTITHQALKNIHLIYASSTCQGTTYTVAPSNQVLPHTHAFMSLPNHQTYEWYTQVHKSSLYGNMFPNCTTCHATFPDSKELTTHQMTHKKGKNAQSNIAIMDIPLASSESSDEDELSEIGSEPRRADHDIVPDMQIPETNSTGILQKQIYRPDILDQIDVPKTFLIFWKLQAYTRPHTKRGRKYLKWVAPKFPKTMLELETHVNYKGLLSDEFVKYAKAYQSIVVQKDFSSVDQLSHYPVGVFNDAHILTILGKGSALDNLRKQAPQLETKSLNTLTEATLQSFFFQARSYMLNSSIPWDSFPEYFLTNAALGPDILAKTQDALQGYPTYKKVLRTLSAFIERIIHNLLPAQESYHDSETRIIEEHRSQLLGANPNVDYSRIKLQADSRELVTKSPHYIQYRSQISDESKRLMIEAQKTNLLSKILANTTYEAKLYKLLIASDSYKTIESVPYNVLLDHLQNLILADKKSEIALVHASKALQLTKSRGRPTLRSPARSNLRSPARSNSRDHTPPTPSRQRSNSRSSPIRSRRQSPGLQSKCDICLKLEYPTHFCKRDRHCRVAGHQPTFKDSITYKKRIDNNESDLFTIHNNCRKCNTLKNASYPPKSMQWLQHSQTNNANSSQVVVPPNYFQQPYQLHPMSAHDISLSARQNRFPAPPNQRPYTPPNYPPPPLSAPPAHNGSTPYSQPFPRRQQSRSPSRDQSYRDQHHRNTTR